MEQSNETNKKPLDAEEATDKVTAPEATASPAAVTEEAAESKSTKKSTEKPLSKSERTKKYWKRRLRRRRRRRRVRRFFFFLFALLLGMVVAYGALFLAAYFALGGLTIDTLQRFGIAKDADQYLTENGDVDLTDMSLLELLTDLQAVSDNLSSYSLNTLIEHYGLVLPEDIQRVMPTDLYDVPLDQLFSDQAGTVVAENLTMGYILSFMPENMLNPRVIETISPRPLSLLTNSDFGALFADVQMGYLTGVTYNESGEVVYLDPAVPTFQEVTAKLDLGELLHAATKNGDLLKVIAENIGDAPAGPFVMGITEGAMIDDVMSDMKVSDIIVLNESTARYEFSISNLTANAVLGKTMGYTLVDGVWYSTYTDNGDATDDVRVTGLNAALANLSLGAMIDNQLSLTEVFGDLYVGDLQSGYARGDAIYGTPEGDEEPPVIGYEWLKDGAPLGKTPQALANIALASLLEGNLDMTAVLGDVLVGDVAGYVLVDNVWYKTYTDNGDSTDDVEVGGINAALAGVSLASLIDGEIEISEIFADMYLGDLQSGYERGDAIYGTPVAGEEPPVIGYEWLKNGATLTEMHKALANIALSDLLDGNLVLTDSLGDVLVGDAAGYVLVDGVWYKTYTDNGNPADDVEVGGINAVLANVSLAALIDGEIELSEIFVDMYLGDLQSGYERGNAIYGTPVAGEAPPVVGYEWLKDGVKASEMQKALANIALSDLLDGNLVLTDSIGDVLVGDAAGYVRGDEIPNVDPNAPKQYAFMKADNTPVAGVMLKFANLSIGELLNGTADLEASVKDMTIAEVMEFTKVGGVYYSTYVGENDPANVKVTGVLAAIADQKISNLNQSTVDSILLGELLGFEKNGSSWLENGSPVTGVSAKLADCTVGMLSDPDDLIAKLRELTLAEALGYEKVGGVYYHNGQPVTGILAALAEKPLNGINSATIDEISLSTILGLKKNNGVWVDKNGTPVSGITAKLAECTVAMLSDTETFAAKLRELTLAEALGYEKVGGVYYHNGQPVTGILAALAEKPLNAINSATIDEISLSTILGLKKNNGVWVDENGNPVSGVTAKLAECTVAMLSDSDTFAGKLRELTLAEAMGYKKNGNTYYNNGQPVTGILAELAETSLKDINSTAIDGILIGKVMGYQQRGDNWYKADGTTPVEGLLAAFADLKVGDLDNSQNITEAIQAVTLGDALGYTKKADGHWYHTVGGEETLVRGLLAVLADSTVGAVDFDINSIPVGTILNYHKANDGFWYDEENVKQTGISALLAEETLDTLAPRIKALTIDDMMPNREGLLSTIDGSKPFSELESECKKALHDATMGTLADAGIIDESVQTKLDAINPIMPGWWRAYKINAFLNFVLSRLG